MLLGDWDDQNNAWSQPALKQIQIQGPSGAPQFPGIAPSGGGGGGGGGLLDTIGKGMALQKAGSAAASGMGDLMASGAPLEALGDVLLAVFGI